MALFGTLPVGGRVPRLSAPAQNRIAARSAIRAHPHLCQDAGCPVPQVLAELIVAPAITRPLLAEAGQARCPTTGRTLGETAPGWLTARSTREERLAQSAAMVLRGFQTGKSVHGWCSVRESARLAASERGLEEARMCCIEIARLC
ncbi:MAG: hypothetical protein ACJ8BC_17670, partial [Gemmatimonadales bacterium]